MTWKEIVSLAKQGTLLHRDSATRSFYIEQPNLVELFINGQDYKLRSDGLQLAQALCDDTAVEPDFLLSDDLTTLEKELLQNLINEGAWYFASE
jgi:hypothetical protein